LGIRHLPVSVKMPMKDEKKAAMNHDRPTVTFKGRPVILVGNCVQVGEQAPDFIAADHDLSPVPFSTFLGRPCIISSIVSVDTEVCDAQTRRFNEEAAALNKELQILTISMDLPFAQQRWCAAKGVKRITMLSDYRDACFGTSYGLLIKGLRLLARAVFAVDAGGRLTYKEIVSEITNEPDYDKLLDAARRLA